MVTRLGLIALAAGLLTGLFGGISLFMGKQSIWVGMTISTLIGQEQSESIILYFSSLTIQNLLDQLFYDVPAFALLMALGVILLIVSMFVKSK